MLHSSAWQVPILIKYSGEAIVERHTLKTPTGNNISCT